MNINGECKFKKCSELDNDRCRDFGIDERGYLCLEKSSIDPDTYESISLGCALQQCSDLPVGECFLFQYDELLCQENQYRTRCELKTCSDLSPRRCNGAYFFDDGIQCSITEDGKSCVTEKCSDYNSNECSNFIQRNNEWVKCLPEGDGCKIKECQDLTPPNCEIINQIQRDEFTCIENEGMCQLVIKRCEDLPYEYCGLYPSSIFYSIEGKHNCVKNENNKKCELKSCENTPPTECDKFKFYGDEGDEICTLHDEGNRCEILKCSELSSDNCNKFIPNNKGKKCVSSGSKCQITEISCEELSENECHYYNSFDEEKFCVPDGDGKCKISSCEELDSDKCWQFKSINENKQCISTTSGCQLLECQDLLSNECDKFLTDDLTFTCENEGNSNCVPRGKNCEDYPIKYCSEIYSIALCVLNDKTNKCENIYRGYISKDNPDDSDPHKSNNNKSNIILLSFSSIYLLLLLL